MRLFLIYLACLSALITFTSAVPLQSLKDAAGSKPIPPTEDPFYTPPEGYEDKTLGAILKHRKVNSPGFLFLKTNLKESLQIMYRSSNSSGSPMAAVTTVLIPENADRTKLLSYQIYEDSSYLNCAPSYGLQFGSNPEAIVAQVEFLTMQAALNEGWIVNTPDYEGPNSAFTAGYVAGHATLDSIRAVLGSRNITGVQKKATVAMWGYSGGSLASGWAAELQPEYAPELEIVGAAVGGYVPNVNTIAMDINKGPFVGLVPTAIYGLGQEYPELKQLIDEQLYPSKRDAFFKVGKQCLLQDATQFAFQDWGSYCKNGTAVLQHPIARKVTTENTLGNHTPKNIPLFLYHSLNDEISDIKVVEKTVKSYCSNGASVEFVKDMTSEHITEAISGSADAFLWLKDRMNGKPVEKGCSTRTTFATGFDKGAPFAFGREIGGALASLFGIPIGPKAIG